MKESEIRPQELFNRYLELSRKDIDRYFADRSRFLEAPCPGCGSERRETGLEKLGFTYVSCSDCGSLYLSPRPTAKMIQAYYQQSEAVKFWGTHFFKETAEARREKMFKPRAQLVREWADRLGMDRGSTLVDIGSGYGIFLEEVAALGRFDQVIGIEPAPNLAAICRSKGFGIIEKPAEAVTTDEVVATFATAFEVLEHLYAPVEFLSAVGKILEAHGLVLFTTLVVTGFDIQVLWEHSKSVYPPHHINLLSLEGLRRLVERSGLDIVELSTPGELDVDIVRNALAEDPQIEIPRFARAIVDGTAELRLDFQDFLNRNCLSSHVRVLGRRSA